MKMKKELFKPLLGDWYSYFESFLESKELYDIYQKLQKDSNDEKDIFPYCENTFKAFELCDPKKLKLVVLSQDPYPGVYYDSKLPHATGLCLDNSNSSKNKLQPSLEYFWEGIAEEFGGKSQEYATKDLRFLANQGILLGNRALTVEKEMIGSHKGLWDPLWKFFFVEILPTYFSGVQVLFLGKDAFKLKSYVFNIANPIHYLDHPSFAARNGQLWETKKTFSNINNYLELNNPLSKINWKFK